MCPVCGQAFREGKTCPKYKKAVCIGCCKICNYQRTPAHFNRGCRFYEAPENQWMRLPGEIRMAKNKLNYKADQVSHFYSHNKPWIAEKIENEARVLRGRIRHMEEEYERRKETGN